MADSPLSATELGNLWQAYQEKSMTLRALEYFLEQADVAESRQLLQRVYSVETANERQIRDIFQNDGVAVPAAFSAEDVNVRAPRLFDGHFDLMYVRMMSKVLIGLYALHMGMSYRPDVRKLYMDFTTDSMDIYNQTTQRLLDLGALARPPIVELPNHVEFITDTGYTSGLNPFEKKRTLNTVEIGLVYQSLETNITGKQLMTAFAQAAKEAPVKKYFRRGKELADKVESAMRGFLLDSDLTSPSTWAGVITDSSSPPFSDKLMMYNTNLLAMFGLGSNSVGAAFSFRSDLLLKMGRIMSETLEFAKDGGKIMMEYGWMEKPPQAPDHRKLSHV